MSEIPGKNNLSVIEEFFPSDFSSVGSTHKKFQNREILILGQSPSQVHSVIQALCSKQTDHHYISSSVDSGKFSLECNGQGNGLEKPSNSLQIVRNWVNTIGELAYKQDLAQLHTQQRNLRHRLSQLYSHTPQPLQAQNHPRHQMSGASNDFYSTQQIGDNLEDPIPFNVLEYNMGIPLLLVLDNINLFTQLANAQITMNSTYNQSSHSQFHSSSQSPTSLQTYIPLNTINNQQVKSSSQTPHHHQQQQQSNQYIIQNQKDSSLLNQTRLCALRLGAAVANVLDVNRIPIQLFELISSYFSSDIVYPEEITPKNASFPSLYIPWGTDTVDQINQDIPSQFLKQDINSFFDEGYYQSLFNQPQTDTLFNDQLSALISASQSSHSLPPPSTSQLVSILDYQPSQQTSDKFSNSNQTILTNSEFLNQLFAEWENSQQSELQIGNSAKSPSQIQGQVFDPQKMQIFSNSQPQINSSSPSPSYNVFAQSPSLNTNQAQSMGPPPMTPSAYFQNKLQAPMQQKQKQLISQQQLQQQKPQATPQQIHQSNPLPINPNIQNLQSQGIKLNQPPQSPSATTPQQKPNSQNFFQSFLKPRKKEQ